jgi:hypothetical protein
MKCVGGEPGGLIFLFRWNVGGGRTRGTDLAKMCTRIISLEVLQAWNVKCLKEHSGNMLWVPSCLLASGSKLVVMNAVCSLQETEQSDNAAWVNYWYVHISLSTYKCHRNVTAGVFMLDLNSVFSRQSTLVVVPPYYCSGLPGPW